MFFDIESAKKLDIAAEAILHIVELFAIPRYGSAAKEYADSFRQTVTNHRNSSQFAALPLSLDQGKDAAAQKPRSLCFAVCVIFLFNPAHGSRLRGPFWRNAEDKNIGIPIDTRNIIPGAVDRPGVVDSAAAGRQRTIDRRRLRKYVAALECMRLRIVVHPSMFE